MNIFESFKQSELPLLNEHVIGHSLLQQSDINLIKPECPNLNEEDTLLLKLRASGKELKEIGTILGIAESTVCFRLKKLKENGYKSSISKNFCLKDKEGIILDMYQRGIGVYKIAQILDVSPKSIYKRLKKQNIPLQKVSILASQKEEVISLYTEGYPVSYIAQRFDCACETVKNLLKKERIPKKKPRLKKRRVSQWASLEPQIKQLYKKGLTFDEISKKTGLKRCNVAFFVRTRKWKRAEIFKKKRPIVQEDLAVRLYTQDCLPKTEIAKRFGCSTQTITKIFRKQKLKSSKFYLTEKIKTFYDSGLTYKEIAQKMGSSESSICHFIKRRNWTRLKCRPEHTKRISKGIESIIALYLRGIQIPEIAKKIGCSRPTIRKILKQQGVYHA